MSALSHQSAINPNSNFWAKAIPSINSSTITVNNLNANNISTGILYADVALMDEATISSISTNAIELDGAYLTTVNGTEVLLNGIPIATTADLSSITDWSLFPAVSTIQTANANADIGSLSNRFRTGYFSTLYAGNAILESTTVTLTETLSSQFVNVVQASTINVDFLNADIVNTSSLVFSNAIGGNITGQTANFSTIFASSFTSINTQNIVISSFVGNTLTVSTLNAQRGSISSLNVSSLRGNQVVIAGLNVQNETATNNLTVGGTLAVARVENVSTIRGNRAEFSTLQVRRLEDVSTLNVGTGNFSTINTSNLFGLVTLGARNATFSTINASNVYVPGQLYGNDVRGNQGTFSNFINVGWYSNILSNGYNANINSSGDFTTNGGINADGNVVCADIDAEDITCCNVTVGSALTGLADVEIYGATAVPGDSALYVEGGVEFDGGLIHGFSAGALPVAGVNTQRFSLTPVGIAMISPTFITLDSGATANIATGGAFSLAVGGVANLAAGTYMEIDTGFLKLINNTPLIFSANSGTGAPGGLVLNTYLQSNSLQMDGLPFGALDKIANSNSWNVSSGNDAVFLESIPFPKIGQWYVKASFTLTNTGGGTPIANSQLYFAPTINPTNGQLNQTIYTPIVGTLLSTQTIQVGTPVLISTITGYTSTINSTIIENFSTFFSTGQTFSTFTSTFFSTIVADGGLNLYFDPSQHQNNFNATLTRASLYTSYLGGFIPNP